MILINQSESHMGADYGPPDPPPSMEITHSVRIIQLYSDKEVLDWIEQYSNKKYRSPEKFKVIKIEPVKIKTEVTISMV